MAVKIHTKEGITVLPAGERVPAGAWKATEAARSDGGASAKKLKDALDRAERALKTLRPHSRLR